MSISSITDKQVDSPRSSSASCRSNRCLHRNAGASFANCNNWCCVVCMWIITLLCDTNLGSKRLAQRQSLIRLRRSGVWQFKLAFLSLVFKITELSLLSSQLYCKLRIHQILGLNSHSSSGLIAQRNQISWWLWQWRWISIKLRGEG